MQEDSIKRIQQQIILPGLNFFHEMYIKQVSSNRKQKRQTKSKQIQHLTQPSKFSIFNLFKFEPKKLPNDSLLAAELLNATFIQSKNLKIQDHLLDLRFYQDYQETKRLNQRFLHKIFLKPLKQSLKKSFNFQKQNWQDLSKKKTQQIINKSNESQLQKFDLKYIFNPKLFTTPQMIPKIEEKIISYQSTIKNYIVNSEFQKSLGEIKLNFFLKAFFNLKRSFNKNSEFSSSCIRSKLKEKFSNLFQYYLPEYLRQQHHQNLFPIPWKMGLLQKQIQRQKFSQISGKVLYKYEHNLNEIKERNLKIRVNQEKNKTFAKFHQYFNRLWQKNRKQMKKNTINIITTKREQNKKDFQYNQQKYSTQLQNGITKISEVERIKKEGQKLQNFISERLLSKGYHHPKLNYLNGSNSQLSLTEKSHVTSSDLIYKNNRSQVNIRHPQHQNNQLVSVNNTLDLDQYKFSKNSYFLQHQQLPINQEKQKSSSLPRNIYVTDKTNQKYNEKQINADNNIKKLVKNKNNHFNLQNMHSENSSFMTGPADYLSYGDFQQFSQGKKTKKKLSVIKNFQPVSHSNNFIQKKGVYNSQKVGYLSFYPLKIGNLILQNKNICYLQYNSFKESVKNLPVKFLLDRQRHKCNIVEIILPSLEHNQSTITANKQKAKEIIKIVLMLGGQLRKVKPLSSYNQDQRKDGPKIGAQLQIYKFFYRQMSYFQIIDTLNLENYWLQKKKQNQKIQKIHSKVFNQL